MTILRKKAVPPGPIAILTAEKFMGSHPDWYAQQVKTEDNLLIDALKKHGIQAERISWSDPSVKWANLKLGVLRTTWDYFDRIDEFRNWMNEVSRDMQVVNPPKLVFWNLDKHYLQELSRKGIAISPTIICEKGEKTSLQALFEKTEWTEAIIKPTISGAARDTFRISQNETHLMAADFQVLLEKKALLFQKFEPTIVLDGEISLMFFGQIFSHAVRKQAKPGDFRVQDDHGGKVYEYQPSTREIQFGLLCLQMCPIPPIYARVDLVHSIEGSIRLMELELIEPELFFRFQPQAADLYASEIARIIKSDNWLPGTR